ncbi:MAG: VOC family protein [Paracoccaceae bacterium]
MSGPAAISGLLEAALYTDDLGAAEAFYGDILGLEQVLRAPGAHVFYRCGGVILLIFDPASTAKQGGGYPPVPPHGGKGASHLCFSATAEEIESWRTRLLAHGVAIEADFRWPNGARSLYFRDPAGNSLEFAERRLWFDEDS